MKKKFIWLFCLMLGILLIISCGPSTPTGTTNPPPATTTAPPVTTTKPPTTTAPPATTATSSPKYGGILNISWPNDPSDFDQAYRSAWQSYTLDATNEMTIGADWTKGPAGDKSLRFQGHDWPPMASWKGYLVESWDMTDPLNWVLHVRKGVKFHNKPPVNGRELTAQDIVVSYNRMLTMPTSFAYAKAHKPTSVTATDKYTILVKFNEFDFQMPRILFDHFFVIPYDMVQDSTGKETEALRNWKNSCGTGPFMLTDYVKGGSLTLDKNPNYWQEDPLHKGNKLPYLDGIKVKIIPELPTRIAAIRTGAIDCLGQGFGNPGVPWEQEASLSKSNPELRKVEILPEGGHIVFMRTDMKPFSDIKVRQALSMAIDRDAMAKDLYQGHAEKLMWFYHPVLTSIYTPYDKLPAAAKEVLTYNPEKAKQLLVEAGYPNGFDAEILTQPLYEDQPVYIANAWSKIGVRAKVDLREYAVFKTTEQSLKYSSMGYDLYGNMEPGAHVDFYRAGYYTNYSIVTNTWWNEQANKALATFDETARNKILIEMSNYSLEQAYVIPLPTPTMYVFWQPWLKGWEGANEMGVYHFFRGFYYSWLDKGK